MDTRRLILFIIFSMSLLMLWEAWQRNQAPIDNTASVQNTDPSIPAAPSNLSNALPVDDSVSFKSVERVVVNTDLYKAEIDTTGGDLRKLTLLKYKADGSKTDPYILLDDQSAPKMYVAQSGLLGHDLPTHKSLFTTSQSSYTLADGQDVLSVALNWSNEDYNVVKTYVFHREHYVIDVNYSITNNSTGAITPAAYYQIVHDDKSSAGSALRPTFSGGIYYTDNDLYNKLEFSDMEDEAFKLNTDNGWVGFQQLYFVSAWIPKNGINNTFFTKQLDESLFSMGTKNTLQSIAPGETANVTTKLFTGPQDKSELVKAAPGLDLTIDYGMLKMISVPLFWLLDKIHGLVNNWGIAIILLTVLIKILFYPLAAKSYRSMAQLRELSPRLQSMKEKFGDDRQKLQVAMMELYKTEKINPMSGCLPMLAQLPVFISLYWVLLNSVELRNAPFMGWIQDLSLPDPYYILPIVMGATMFIQSSLNPPAADPIQAKVMKIMPVAFSIFFFFFPAGLVLYWLVNNILSVWQQWYVNKKIHAEAVAKKVNAAK